ncbi:hypothetical protein L4Z02_001487 [Pseudomonas aeruginosa]|nr:hypothetical protein [Pseudomonas aeruginosa]
MLRRPTIWEMSRNGTPAKQAIHGAFQRIYERTCDAYDRELENGNYKLVPELTEEMAQAYGDLQKFQ